MVNSSEGEPKHDVSSTMLRMNPPCVRVSRELVHPNTALLLIPARLFNGNVHCPAHSLSLDTPQTFPVNIYSHVLAQDWWCCVTRHDCSNDRCTEVSGPNKDVGELWLPAPHGSRLTDTTATSFVRPIDPYTCWVRATSMVSLQTRCLRSQTSALACIIQPGLTYHHADILANWKP